MVLIKPDTILSPAKINLFLKVIKKQSNGMHQIYSFVSLINLFDKITISESDKEKIKFSGKFSKNISLKNNTILKVVHYLKFFYPSLRTRLSQIFLILLFTKITPINTPSICITKKCIVPCSFPIILFINKKKIGSITIFNII